MTDILKFINDNAGAFNVVFTGVVAVATVIYAVLTARLVKETERLRAAATEPRLEVTYRARDEAMALLDLVVKNVGSGPAYQIRFDVSAAPVGIGAEELLRPLREMKALQSGMNVLMPGQEFSAFWTDARQNFEAKLQTLVTVSSACSGASGVKYVREHQIDLSELMGAQRVGTPSLLAIAQNLEKLQNDIHHLSTGFNRIKVDTFTETDRARERADWEERRAQIMAQNADSSNNGV